jgi:hypothetical protein
MIHHKILHARSFNENSPSHCSAAPRVTAGTPELFCEQPAGTNESVKLIPLSRCVHMLSEPEALDRPRLCGIETKSVRFIVNLKTRNSLIVSSVFDHKLQLVLSSERDRLADVTRLKCCDGIRRHKTLFAGHVSRRINVATRTLPNGILHCAGLVRTPERAFPVRFSFRTTSLVVIWVMARPGRRTRGNETSADRGVEAGPDIRRRPACLRSSTQVSRGDPRRYESGSEQALHTLHVECGELLLQQQTLQIVVECYFGIRVRSSEI